MAKDKCFQCGEINHSEIAVFCTECGIELENKCSNTECCHVNKDSAMFCELCGCTNLYFEKDLLVGT